MQRGLWLCLLSNFDTIYATKLQNKIVKSNYLIFLSNQIDLIRSKRFTVVYLKCKFALLIFVIANNPKQSAHYKKITSSSVFVMTKLI